MKKNQKQHADAYLTEDLADSLVKKWAPILDYSSRTINPIEDDRRRINTAILLENQERWCLTEANISGNGGAFGSGSTVGGIYNPPGQIQSSDAYATGDARLPKVLIPMIRRTFPELITNEIVGVQPMTGPVGLAFALRYRYESDALGYGTPTGADGSVAQGTGGWTSASDGQEVGWNYLNTAFTGTSSNVLSGNSDFDVISQDAGVAALISQFELSSRIPQAVITFEKTAVEAGTRRLATKWSLELEQDLKNMTGIDIDAEMTSAMSYEIQAEIDREMVIRMIQICLNAGNPQGYSFWNAASADARWLGERARDFYARVVVEANRIAIRNRRGAANFIIATPRVCAMLEILPEFSWLPVNGNVNTSSVGIAKVGTVGGRFNVYRDTRTEAQYQVGLRQVQLEYALLGYKGSEYWDSGILYCPYIPVMIQRTIGPNDFSPRVGIMTRYGVIDHLFGADLYYHLIICTNFGNAFTPGAQATFL